MLSKHRFAAPAFPVSSGWHKFFGPQQAATGYPHECAYVQADVVNSGTNPYSTSSINAKMWADCSANSNRPASWLKVMATAYRNGTYCGSTLTLTNAGSVSTLGVDDFACSNPGGTQLFETYGHAEYLFNGYWKPGGKYSSAINL